MVMTEQSGVNPEWKCEVCRERDPVGVFAMPGVPVSFAYCRVCAAANAHPYDMVVVNTAIMGGLGDDLAQWWHDIVNDTLAHLGIDREKFLKDVANEIEAYKGMDL